MNVFLDLCGTDGVSIRFSGPVRDRSSRPRPAVRSDVMLYGEVVRPGSCEGDFGF